MVAKSEQKGTHTAKKALACLDTNFNGPRQGI
jgi:hypothetical protein